MSKRKSPKEVKVRLSEFYHDLLLKHQERTGETLKSMVARFVKEGLDREIQKGTLLPDTKADFPTTEMQDHPLSNRR